MAPIMKIALYVDDERDPKYDHEFNRLAGDADVVVVRTYDEATDAIVRSWGSIEVLSLDHDLGGKKTGYDLACLLEELIYIHRPSHCPLLRCHSANPTGHDNIERAFDSIKRMRAAGDYWIL